MPRLHFLPLVATALLLAACTGQAQQQQPQRLQTSTGLQEVEDENLMVQPLGLTVGEIEEDADLLDSTGEEVGDIDVVLADASGRPVAIAAEVGSYADGADKTVVIGLDRLSANEDDDLVTTLTLQELQQLLEWDE